MKQCKSDQNITKSQEAKTIYEVIRTNAIFVLFEPRLFLFIKKTIFKNSNKAKSIFHHVGNEVKSCAMTIE